MYYLLSSNDTSTFLEWLKFNKEPFHSLSPKFIRVVLTNLIHEGKYSKVIELAKKEKI